jgi:uncharacterized membrane protein YfcA
VNDPHIVERIVVRITEVLLLGIFVHFAIQLPSALPWCTGAMGLIIGSRTGAGIANRVKEETMQGVVDKVVERIRAKDNAP